MPDDFESQNAALRKAVQQHSNDIGTGLVKETAEAARSLLAWIAYLRKSDEGLPTAALLEGTQAAIVEVAACLALGLVRPALASLRAQIDMVLAWLYFKDHPVEWRQLVATGEDSRLRGEVNRPGFPGDRFS